jgi:hypothetical protein
MRELKLKIFDISIVCLCEEAIYDRLAKDFHYFVTEAEIKDENLKFTFSKETPPWEKLNGLICTKQSFNSMTYKKGAVLLNDYYGKALSILDLERQIAHVYSEDIERLYEISYLLILSRTGKFMDLVGYHKLHGFGVAHEGTAFLGMMPSKGGKSTLFLDLIQNNSDYEIISDDTPVIDWCGTIHSFPLRIGIEPDHKISEKLLEKSYSIERTQWGRKILIPMTSFPNKIADKKTKVILLSFQRVYNKSCKIEKASFFETFKNLQTHMVVGVGLPMILEYFLEFNIKDFFRLGAIFFKRIFAAFSLALFSVKYKIYLGSDVSVNHSTIDQFIKNKK